MKCFIEYESLYYNLYWIKNCNNKVIGSFYGNYFNHFFGFPVETHFNYPYDGKIHYSYKSEEQKRYITAFYDQVKDKERSSISFCSEKTVLNHLLPEPQLQVPLCYYNRPDIFFHFPTIGFAVPIPKNAAILQYYRTQTKQPDERDLVISVNSLDPGTLNIRAFIASKECYQQSLNHTNYWQVMDTTKTPIIGISANYFSN